jgi:hypothetical protein
MYAAVKNQLIVMMDKAKIENNVVKLHGGIFSLEDIGKYQVIIDRSTIINNIAQMGSASIVYAASSTSNADI